MRQETKKKVAAVLRVSSGTWYAGDILVDRRGRVHHAGDTLPQDVVLKALVAQTRGSKGGNVISRRDGEVYRWFLVEAEVGAACAA